jgi:predicted P-loop ATPase
MISAIARIKNPSCFVDTITCLVGQQGIGKSKFISKLAVQDDWFTDGITSFDGKEFYEGIQGKWIIELGEGTAFKKSTKEIAKQRASATKDTYRLPYAILPEDRPRQCIFIATVNDYKFLKDETGNRRYYPIDCNKSKAKYTFNDLTPEVLAQIWAEALFYYNQGEKWYLDESEKEIIETAITEQEKHYENSSLYDDMDNFLSIKVPDDWYKLPIQDRRYHIHAVLSDTYPKALDGSPLRLEEKNTREYVSITEILCEYYDKTPNEIFNGREKTINSIKRALKELGYKSGGRENRKYIGGYRQQTIYVKEK